MSLTMPAIVASPATRPGGAARRRVVRVAALLVGAALAFGVTVWVHSRTVARHQTVVAPASPAVVPTSPWIEQEWGIRFTTVRLLAATGVIDVRYLVFDPSKADRLHADGKAGLPRLRTDGGTVQPDSVMFHFHTESDTAGHSFDILYANARGALRVGSRVTIVMRDGLELANVPVVE